MDASSRQSEILEQLDRIRRELARKERKLQKLKRLSAQKRSCDSAESSSVIAVEDTRSPVSPDVRSPLRPIETTLSQSEICQSKPLRTVDLQERSVLFRGSNLDELEADENACGRRSRADGTRAGVGERELPIGAQYGDVQASCAPSCGRTSPPAAPQGLTKVEEQKPLSSDVCRPLNESTPDKTRSDAPLQTASHSSPRLVSLAESADNSAAEASAVPTPAVCTPAGNELCSTSVNVSKSKDAAVLSTADGLSTAVSVRHRVPQDEGTQFGNMSVSTPEHSQRGDKHVANSSRVGSIGQSPKSSAYVPTNSAPCIEKQFSVTNDIHTLSTLDGESLYYENMGNSQKEIFEDHEVHLESQGTHCSSTSQEAATEGSAFESSEMSEPPWERTETSCSSSSKSWSPVRKRRRTVCEVSVASGSADLKGYNFRQRRLSHNPLVIKRMSREAKTILGAFQKLIEQARKLPVSTFQLPFEQLGLAQYQEAKSVSGCRENHKRPRTSFCDIMSSEEQLDQTDVKAKECTRNGSPCGVQTTKTTSSFESLCAALSLLPKRNPEVTPKAANCEKRETRSIRRQRGLSSLPSSSACQESEPQFVTTSAVTCDFHSSKTVSLSSCPVVHSICSTADDSCGAAIDGVLKGSPDIHGHGSSETELPTASRLAGDQAIVPHCSKRLGKVEPLAPGTAVSEVGVSHGKTEQSLTHICVSQDASDQGTDTDDGSCEITAIEVPTDMTGGVCFQDVNRVHRNLIASPQEAGDHMRLVDQQNCYRINKQASAGSTHVVLDGNKCYLQEFDTNAQQQDKSCCTALSEQEDTCKLDVGEDSGCDDGDGVLGAESPAHSTLFTQSEESDGTGGEINEFVTTVVQQLGPQTGGAADCVPVDKSQDSQSSQSGSTTPDNLDFPEGHARSPGVTPKHRSPPHGKQDPVSEFVRGRRRSHQEEGGLTNNVDKAQGTNSPSLLDASEEASDHPLKTAELASGACVPTPVLLGAKETDSGSQTADVHSHRATPPPSEGARKTEELAASCLPGANSRCVAKKLFVSSPVRKKALAANSDFSELLDPQVLEGMFDEWSEGLDCATRSVDATDMHDRGSASQIPGSSKEHDLSNMPAVAGGCREGTADNTSVHVTHGEVGGSPAGGVLSESSQRHQSSEIYSADTAESKCQSRCHEGGVAEEVEHGSPETTMKGSVEAGRRLLAEDQCSQSVSSSLEALSGISRFSDEVEEKGPMPHPEEEEQLSCEDLGSPLRPGGMCDGLAEEDHDGAGWDNLDDTYEEHCQGTPHHHGSSLGTHNPLLLSCTLKCEEEQPVAGLHLVQTDRHPFLVSVQASAINVWHLENCSWRHSLVMRRLKFRVEEDHCLLACEHWTVLVYLNARAPLYLPCLEWRTQDGQDGSQLLLTLGSLGSADGLTLKRSQRIYRIAKLNQEGQFATALRTTGGATLLRVHRLRHMHGELGDETDVLGRTSNLLDSLVCVVGQPDALLGNSANIFYVWDCNNRVLVKKMIHEPDMFADLRRISWCSSDRGLLFVLMQSSDDVTSALVAMNPFSCKAEFVTSLCWKLAAKACTGDLRSCGTQVEGHYVACVTPGYGVRIWNLFTGNPVANMWYRSSVSVTMAELSGSMVTAVGLDDGHVLVFTS